MKWTKAHEALPDDNKDVIVRWSQYAPDDRIDLSNAHQLKVWMEERPTITFYWLDESPPASAVEEAARMYPKEIVLGKENGDRFTFNQLAEIQRQAHITCAGMYTGELSKLKEEVERLKKLSWDLWNTYIKPPLGPFTQERVENAKAEFKLKHNL